MKVGDQMSVSLDGFEVALATIEDISDGKATILIPATRVVMGVKQQLVPNTPEVDREFGGMEEGATSTSQAADEANSEVTSLRDMDLDSSGVDKDE